MLNYLKNQQAKRIDFFLSLDIFLGLLSNIYGLKKIQYIQFIIYR